MKQPNSDDISAVLAMTLVAKKVELSRLLEIAGVEVALASRLIRTGLMDDPSYSSIVSEILAPVGLSTRKVGELLSRLQRRKTTDDTRQHVEFLARKYIIKAELPKHDREPLVAFCRGLVVARETTTVARAARLSPPRKVMDVAHIHNHIKRHGFDSSL